MQLKTNIERAADIIAPVTTPLGTSIARGVDRATLAAQALADAGLLMPDLPRPMEVINPDWAKFNEHIDVLYGDVRVYFAGDFGEYPENLTPADAREQALELLAAADYAEQEQGNG